jgi:hypothetical protein
MGEMQRVIYIIGRKKEEVHLRLDILDGLSRTVEERINLGWIPIKIPVMDDMPYRIFETMEEYRRWLERALPKYLGYYRKDDRES